MNTASGREERTTSDGAGEWVTPDVSYVNPHRRFCDLCGRPIARRYWQTAMGGEARIYCDPAHAALDTTYPRSPIHVGDYPGEGF